MKVTLSLRRQIWNQEAPPSKINQALAESAVELDEDLHSYIDQSDPQGRIYRLRTLTSRRTAQNVGHRRRGTSSRVVVGAEFYRASAPGQPPAKRTGALYRGITVKRIGNTSIRASVDKKYAGILDDPNRLNRPFFRTRCQLFFRTRFRQNVKARLNELL